MDTTSHVFSYVFIALMVFSSVNDFRRQADIVATMRRFALPQGFEIVCGVTKVLAAIGLAVGLIGTPTGHGQLTRIVAFSLVAYFAIAVGLHLRAKDGVKDFAPALVVLLTTVAFAYVTTQI
jgi:hypothetical protein